MINANDARGLMNYEKAMKFINKNIKKAALDGKSEYVYTTNYKTKASKIVHELKKLNYIVRFVHTPKADRKHKVIINW